MWRCIIIGEMKMENEGQDFHGEIGKLRHGGEAKESVATTYLPYNRGLSGYCRVHEKKAEIVLVEWLSVPGIEPAMYTEGIRDPYASWVRDPGARYTTGAIRAV